MTFGDSDKDDLYEDTPEEAYEEAREMGMEEIHSRKMDGEVHFAPGESREKLMKERDMREEYPGSISSLGEEEGTLDTFLDDLDTDDGGML